MGSLQFSMGCMVAISCTWGQQWPGQFEFAFFYFLFFLMIEKSGFVLEYNYACLVLFWISLSLLLVFFFF